MTKLYGLATEKLFLAVGIDVDNPRFSWKYESDEAGIFQESVNIRVSTLSGKTVWDSGDIKTSEMNVRYAGEKLLPASDYKWSVTAKLSNGQTVSGCAEFMTGVKGSKLLDDALWISLTPTEAKLELPAFRKEFFVSKPIKKAKLFTSGCGIYEVYLNGSPVKHKGRYAFELKPGFTEPLIRKFYHSFDVTYAIDRENCLSAIVTQGWWSDRVAGYIGRTQCFKAALLISYMDGSTQVISTDESFKASTAHPVKFADVYGGETYDARISMDFTRVGFDDGAWKNALITHAFDGMLEAHRGQSVMCRDDLCRTAEKVYTYRGIKDADINSFGKVDNVKEYKAPDFVLLNGETAVIDFGQNFTGRERIRVSGKKGTKLVIRHGEVLNDENGQYSRGNDGPGGSVYLANMRKALATTAYIIGEEDVIEEYAPRFSFYGFRYITISADSDVKIYDCKGEVITSVDHDSGFVKTGNKLVNRLVENGRWGMYSNYLSVPTDCPQRDERLGWMADTQVFATAALYYSVSSQPFLEKWGQDVRDCQCADGRYTSIAPKARSGRELGAMGWADAGVLVPYYVYRMTGDTTVIFENYHSMKRYMDDFLARRGNKGPEMKFGDWLSFEENSEELKKYLCVCFYAFDALVMSKMAYAIGRNDDGLHYESVYNKQKGFFANEYLTVDNRLKLSQQTAALYALWLELLPDDFSKKAVKKQLIDNIKEKGNRLQTGFLGTAILLPTLSKIGENKLAYTLLLQDAMPSWLYSVKAGATTIWERWNSYSLENGFGDANMNSFNHYAYGCVNEWIFGVAAGIRPKNAGFEDFVIAPIPDKRLGLVEAEYDSICGVIRSAWHYEGEHLICECTVPCNTTAIFVEPYTNKKTKLTGGKHRFVI